MPNVAPIQSTFNTGELSPLAFGRVDFAKYKSGVAQMLNFVPLVQGAATRRPGTVYAANTKSNGAARLLPFIFNDGDAFVLEFGNLYLRFYRNRAQLLSGGVPYEIVSPYAVADVNSLRIVQDADVVYIAHPSYAPRSLSRSALTSWAFATTTFLDGPYLPLNATDVTLKPSGTGGVGTKAIGTYTFTTNPTNGQTIILNGVTWTFTTGAPGVNKTVIPSPSGTLNKTLNQLAADLNASANGSINVATYTNDDTSLTITYDTVGAVGNAYTLAAGTYAGTVSGATLTGGVNSGAAITITASAVSAINGGLGFQSTDVGRLVRIAHGTTTITWGNATITGVLSTSAVQANVNSNFGATTASVLWKLGEWSTTTGFPSFNFMFEDRLGFAASPIAPKTLNMSNTGDFLNYAPTAKDGTVVASNALQFSLNSKQQDPVRWATGDEEGLLCGTSGGEWIIQPDAVDVALSAASLPSARETTFYGSASVDPLRIGKAVLFVQSARRKIREMAFVFQANGFRAPDMTPLGEHSTQSGIDFMTYQQEPYSIVWFNRLDGGLRGMTYDRDQDVVGFHQHSLGGNSDAGKTLAPLVESIVTIPSPDNTSDDTWLLVNRYVNGATIRTVEYIAPFNSNFSRPDDAYFVDCGLTIVNGSPSTAISLPWLPNAVVTVLVDGAIVPDVTLDGSGNGTLTRAGTTIQVGLNYASRLQTLRIEGGSATGTAQGKLKRIHKVGVRLHQTVGLRIGPNFTQMDTVQFRSASDPMGAAVPLFSGDKIQSFEDDYNFDGYVCLEQRQPLPCTVLAIMPQLQTQDDQ